MINNLGKVHIYTGDGKGKTTAALGLALRAAGAGYKVYIIQFLKNSDVSELVSLKKIKNVVVKRFGRPTFIYKKGNHADKISAIKALDWAKKVVNSHKFDLVILDEIFLATFFHLINPSEVVKIIKNKPEDLELVLTGRKAFSQAVLLADYVTEMKEIKHPYGQGLPARKGIES